MTTTTMQDDWRTWLEKEWTALATFLALFGIWMTRIKSVADTARRIWRAIMRVIGVLGAPFRIEHRMDGQDEILAAIKNDLARVKQEVIPHDGLSLRAEVGEIHQQIARVEWFRKVTMEQSTVAMYECNAGNGECTWTNEALCNIYGMTAEDMLGSGWLRAVYPPESQSACWEHWQHCLTHNLPYVWIYTIEHQRTRSRKRYRTRAHIIRSRSGTPLVAQGIVEPLDEITLH